MKYIIIIASFFFSLHNTIAQNDKPKEDDGSRLLYPGGLYVELQKITPRNWVVVGRGGNYVIYAKDMPIVMTQTEYESIPKEDAGKEEAWAKKKLYPKPYEILIQLTPYPIEDYLALKKNDKATTVSQTSLAEIGERYQIETGTLTTRQYLEYSGNKMIADPNTGLYTVMDSDEKNRLVMFALSKEKLLNDNNANVTTTATPQFYIHDYSVTIEYNTDYYKIFPESISCEAEIIVNAVKTILTNQMQ
ncbi:MAG TPA: hypothetical protein PK230_06035 [Chitinophagales bacterium]|nr:hypothetical protein [Chitinophagales bacterium]